jgi:hypothetical protein
MWALYTWSGCILVRNLARVVEFAEELDGFIINHEAMLYVFDAFLMFADCTIFIAMRPGRLIKQAHRAVKATRVSMLNLEDNGSNTAITAFNTDKQAWMVSTN